MKKIMELRNDNLARIEEILSGAEQEERVLTNEEMMEIEALKAEVEALNKQEELVESTRALEPIKEQEDKKVEEQPIMEKRELEVRAQEEAFVDAIRDGQVRNLTVGANGAIIPESVSDRIVAKVKELSPILGECQIVNVKGNYRVIREATATEAQYVEEGATLGGADSTFESVVLKSYVIGALVKVSNSLINNTHLDVVGYVVDRLAKAIAEKLEAEILVGTADKIQGLRNIEMKETAGSALSIDDLIELQCDVYARPEEAMFVCSRDAYKAIRKLKDSNNMPYILADATKAYAETLLGSRICISDVLTGFNVFLLDPKAIVVKFAKEVEIKTLHEKYADQYVTGVIGYVEADATYENAQKVGKLTLKATRSK